MDTEVQDSEDNIIEFTDREKHTHTHKLNSSTFNRDILNDDVATQKQIPGATNRKSSMENTAVLVLDMSDEKFRDTLKEEDYPGVSGIQGPTIGAYEFYQAQINEDIDRNQKRFRSTPPNPGDCQQSH